MTTEKSHKRLFWASFMTLIAAGIGFAVRGAVLKDWGTQFGFTQSELGTITGGGLIGFGVTIIALSFFADALGYGRLMKLAFGLHVASAIVTFAATPVFGAYGKEGAYWCLYVGMWLFALGNGTCEAVINPLTAVLFPKSKTQWLNVLHAGWPLGLILGAVIALGFNQFAADVRWEIKLGIFLVPVLLYGAMMAGRAFPRSETALSGTTVRSMVLACLAPALLVLFAMHALVGYVELGTDSWITNITERVLQNGTWALLAFIWTNALMFTLRITCGPVVKHLNPVGLLLGSAILGTIGLYCLGLPFTDGIWPWIAAATLYAVGKTFYWPTLLGVIAERFPRGGAIALGISGGLAMITAGMLGGPGIGYKQDYFAADALSQTSPAAYDRYVTRNAEGALDERGFPLLTALAPGAIPPVAGLDNAKLKVLDDKTTNPAASVDPALASWWTTVEPYATTDAAVLSAARHGGAKAALRYTAVVPAILALGFLGLLIGFRLRGGYRQKVVVRATSYDAA